MHAHIIDILRHVLPFFPLVGLGGSKKTTSTAYPPWLTNESQQEFNSQQQGVSGLKGDISAIPLQLTPQQTEEATLSPLEQLNATYGTSRDELMRRAAATGSQAALPETLAELGRSQAQQGAQTGLATTAYLQNVPVQRAMAQGSLYEPMLNLQPAGPYPSTQQQTTGGTLLSTLLGLGSMFIPGVGIVPAIGGAAANAAGGAASTAGAYSGDAVP